MGRIQGDLLSRSFRLTKSVIEVSELFPNKPAGWVVAKQLLILRSGTSVGANLREADHAISDAEFAHRCSIARKEASEAGYWLELSCKTNLLDTEASDPILNETIELTRILTSVVIKTQRHLSETKRSRSSTGNL